MYCIVNGISTKNDVLKAIENVMINLGCQYNVASRKRGDTEILLVGDSATWFLFHKGKLLDFNKNTQLAEYLRC